MNWLNIDINIATLPEFIGCDPIARATWLNVSMWCARHENSGRVADCRKWHDRQWQQTCGVTLTEVDSASPLLTWDGSDLVVWRYPIDQERAIREKREIAQRNGKNGGRPRKPPSEPIPKPSQEPTLVSASEPMRESVSGIVSGNGREGKVMEGNNTKAADAALPGLAIPEDPTAGQPGIPAVLDCAEFRAAWDDWIAYRRERHLPAYKDRGLTAQFNTLAEWGPDAAIASIRESIRQQWQGLFAPKSGPRSSKVPWQRPIADHSKGF